MFFLYFLNFAYYCSLSKLYNSRPVKSSHNLSLPINYLNNDIFSIYFSFIIVNIQYDQNEQRILGYMWKFHSLWPFCKKWSWTAHLLVHTGGCVCYLFPHWKLGKISPIEVIRIHCRKAFTERQLFWSLQHTFCISVSAAVIHSQRCAPKLSQLFISAPR